jgi:hypothetical protein
MERKKNLEIEEQGLRNELIYMAAETNTKGSGISLCQVHRKGNVAYENIPELKGVNLDLYRKPAINNWRITVS